MQCQIAVAVVGLPGAGKTTLLNCARDLDLACAEWSSVLAQDFPSAPATREEAYAAAARLVGERGVTHYPRLIHERLTETGSTAHVVAGARNPNELRALRSLYPAFRTVWISTTYAVRFKRCVDRGRLHRAPAIADFIRNDLAELAGGLAEIAASADDILFNDDDAEAFAANAREYLLALLNIR